MSPSSRSGGLLMVSRDSTKDYVTCHAHLPLARSGLFFLRADVRVVGLGVVTYKNGKWDGLYAARDFPDSELALLFGTGWFGPRVPPGFSMASSTEEAEVDLEAAPRTPLPGRHSALHMRDRSPHIPATRSVTLAVGLPPAALGGDSALAGGRSLEPVDMCRKRKASESFLCDAEGRDFAAAALMPSSLMMQLRAHVPALLSAAQDESSTTVIAWPHAKPSCSGEASRLSNRESLCTLACHGMSVDEFSAPLSGREVASLTLQRARVGNAPLGTGAYPVVPIFSDGSHASDSVSE